MNRPAPDWRKHQSRENALVVPGKESKTSFVRLKGVYGKYKSQSCQTGNQETFACGGIFTDKTFSFRYGYVEVRARFDCADGVWPAIWMLPCDSEKYGWPHGGEIDIMERMNQDAFVYQTVHSYYTHTLKQDDNPPNGAIVAIKPNDFNVYGVDFYPDSLVFHINGMKTFTYPRIETEYEGQFPFDMAQYLLIDMQLGGTWVGEVDPTGLPVEMVVDWVRHYQLN
jgi:beta-glucanase (GH16 family)